MNIVPYYFGILLSAHDVDGPFASISGEADGAISDLSLSAKPRLLHFSA